MSPGLRQASTVERTTWRLVNHHRPSSRVQRSKKVSISWTPWPDIGDTKILPHTHTHKKKMRWTFRLASIIWCPNGKYTSKCQFLWEHNDNPYGTCVFQDLRRPHLSLILSFLNFSLHIGFAELCPPTPNRTKIAPDQCQRSILTPATQIKGFDLCKASERQDDHDQYHQSAQGDRHLSCQIYPGIPNFRQSIVYQVWPSK